MNVKKNDKKGMHPEEIKAAIRMRGVTLGQLSVQWGFSEPAVRNALKRELPAVEARISEFLGISLHDIWPDRYTPENIRIRHLVKRKPNVKKARRHCKK